MMSAINNLSVPGGEKRRSFTPLNYINTPKTPNLSPIIKPQVTDSPNFLKRRDPKAVVQRIKDKHRLNRKSPNFNTSIYEAVLDQTISVKSTLKALKLWHLVDIFEKEEIDTMAIFFTIKNSDLELIGVTDEADRKKILEFIASFKTPKKPSAVRY